MVRPPFEPFRKLRLVVVTSRGQLLEGRSQVVACRHATSLVQNIGLTGGAVVSIELCTECPSFVLLAAIVQLLQGFHCPLLIGSRSFFVTENSRLRTAAEGGTRTGVADFAPATDGVALFNHVGILHIDVGSCGIYRNRPILQEYSPKAFAKQIFTTFLICFAALPYF